MLSEKLEKWIYGSNDTKKTKNTDITNLKMHLFSSNSGLFIEEMHKTRTLGLLDPLVSSNSVFSVDYYMFMMNHTSVLYATGVAIWMLYHRKLSFKQLFLGMNHANKLVPFSVLINHFAYLDKARERENQIKRLVFLNEENLDHCIDLVRDLHTYGFGFQSNEESRILQEHRKEEDIREVREEALNRAVEERSRGVVGGAEFEGLGSKMKLSEEIKAVVISRNFTPGLKAI